MAATIKIKNSSTAGAAPTSSDLVQGELAVNVTDKKLYTKNASGTIVKIGDTPSIVDNGDATAITIDSSENVGVGTTSPAYKLHVSNYMGIGTQASSGAGAGINMIPSSTLTNWFVGSNYVNPGAFEIIPSTAGGGSTFSTPAFTLSSSGNLGLGVTPSAWGGSSKILQILNAAFRGAGNSAYVGANYYFDGSNNRYIASAAASLYEQDAGRHIFYNAASGTAGNAITFTQAMTLDASGRLGIGTTSPATKLEIAGAGATADPLMLRLSNASDLGYYWDLWRDNTTGYLNFGSASGGSKTTRMSIDSSGNLLVGTTTQLGSAKATFKAGSTLPAISIGMANSSGTYAAQIFFDGDNTDSGSIDVNNDANTTAYTTSSDYRLKINIQPISNALYKVSQLNPVTWNWKKNPSLGSSGFIAHELQDVCPDAVTGHKDEVDVDGNPVYQGIDTSFLVATLTAAIQEQQQIITQLQADVAALKGQA